MSSLNVGQVNATTVNATNTLNVTNGIVLPSYTTATRPASPSAGQMIYNTTTVDVEVWTGSAWKPFLGQGLRNWTDKLTFILKLATLDIIQNKKL